MRRMSGIDAGMFFAENETTPLQIATVSIFDGPVPTYGEFVRAVIARLVGRGTMRIKAGQCTLGDLACSVTSVIFSVDAVVDSTQASAAAWKRVLDAFLRTYSAVHEITFISFAVRAGYLRYMHGKPRLAGARDFLASRDISLPFDDLHGLATSQEEYFLAEVRRHGLMPFPSTIALVRELRRRGVRTAAVSSHRGGAEVLRRAGAAGLFDVVVGSLDTSGAGLPGASDARLCLQAVRRLRASPGRTAIIEESAVGMAAAREIGFRAIIGVDRIGARADLGEYGADTVVADLSELRLHSTSAA